MRRGGAGGLTTMTRSGALTRLIWVPASCAGLTGYPTMPFLTSQTPMINSDKYFTIVFKDLTKDERLSLLYDYQERFSASSYSHVMDDRDQLLDVLSYAECALGDIGDADREPGDDLEWCEERAAKALPRVRKLLLDHGRKTTSLSSAFIH